MKKRRSQRTRRPVNGAPPKKALRLDRSGPFGLKPPPPHAPRRLRTNTDLRALQRLMTHALVQPLVGPNDDLGRRARDGRRMKEVAAEFIKPNDRLTSFERLQIYARCYWYRLLECASDDCPGLRALLGERKFGVLIRAYLARYPSRSFNLRNLCARLPQFVLEEPALTAPHTGLAHDIARFEWAQTIAFDNGAKPALTPDDIADAPPHRLRLALQPYLSLLVLDWPVDDFVIAVKKRDALRSEASNTIGGAKRASRLKHVRPPKPQRVHLVVHRYENRLYYKRLPAPAFAILSALAAGRTLPQAIAGVGPAVTAEQVREWFATWTGLGWLCRREPVARRK